MILRIIDKTTNLFLRDDFTYDEALEIAIEGDVPSGFYLPKYDLTTNTWVEGLTPEQIASIPQPIVQPTIEDRVTRVESDVDVIVTTLATIEGVI